MSNHIKSLEEKRQLIHEMVRELPVLRARLGVSQADIADVIGVSRQMINSYETGKREMPWTTFTALYAVFKNNVQTSLMIENMGEFAQKVEKALMIESDVKN